MVHMQPVNQQAPLCLDHIDIAVARKSRMQPVAWLTGLSVADTIRKNDEELRGIKWLPGAKELAGELRADELRAAAGRAVQNKNRIAHDPLGIAPRFAERAVMHVQLRQRLTGGESEVFEDELALDRHGILRGADGSRREQHDRDQRLKGTSHGSAPN